MIKLVKWTLAGALALSVAGCGNRAQGPGAVDLVKSAFGAVSAGRGGAAAPADPRQALTRDVIDAAPGGLMVVEIPATGGVAVLSPIGSNDDKVTWGSADGKSVTTQAGFVVATRAIGDDLLVSEVDGFGAALGGAQGYTRQMQVLNGRDETVTTAFECHISADGTEMVTVVGRSYPTRRFRDRCQSNGLIFENIYWIGEDRVLRQSRQWVSEGVGYLLTQRVS